jgi:hypothetical protein
MSCVYLHKACCDFYFFLWVLLVVRKDYRKLDEEEKGSFWKDTLAGGVGLITAGLVLNYVNFLFLDERLRHVAFILVLAGMINSSI